MSAVCGRLLHREWFALKPNCDHQRRPRLYAHCPDCKGVVSISVGAHRKESSVYFRCQGKQQPAADVQQPKKGN